MDNEEFNKKLFNIVIILDDATDTKDSKEIANSWSHMINIIHKMLISGDLNEEQEEQLKEICNVLARQLNIEDVF